MGALALVCAGGAGRAGGLAPLPGSAKRDMQRGRNDKQRGGMRPTARRKGAAVCLSRFRRERSANPRGKRQRGEHFANTGRPANFNSLLLAKRGHAGRWAQAPRMLGACVVKAPRTLWRAAPLRQLAKFAKAANDCTHRTSRSNERKAKDLLACAGACVWGSPLGPLRGISALAGNPKIYPFLGAFPRMPRGARDRAATL